MNLKSKVMNSIVEIRNLSKALISFIELNILIIQMILLNLRGILNIL